jgi:hypothetical protein
VTTEDTAEERERRADELREEIEHELHAPPGPVERQPGESLNAYVQRRMREERKSKDG